MEPEQSNQTVQTPTTHVLHTVTPLSKYLAMVLFVILPFFGGWIGYEYGNNKVALVEVSVQIEQENKRQNEQNIPEMVKEVVEGKYIVLATTSTDAKGISSDGDQDTSEWSVFESEEFGFSFRYPPTDNVVVKDNSFVLHSDVNYRHFLPAIWVFENESGNNTIEEMNKTIYKYTNYVSKTEVDGIPAFRTCTAEGGGCSTYVVTSKYIFRINQFNNLSFDKSVIGEVEYDVDWPEQVFIPSELR